MDTTPARQPTLGHFPLQRVDFFFLLSPRDKAAHHFYGMAFAFNEAPEMQANFPAPPNFPRCGNFSSAPTAADSRRVWQRMMAEDLAKP